MGKNTIRTAPSSSNILRQFNPGNTELKRLRSVLAAQIIQVLDDKALTVRKAKDLTGIAAADFSRIRHAKLDRFTTDRMMAILDRLGLTVEVSVTVHPRKIDNHEHLTQA